MKKIRSILNPIIDKKMKKLTIAIVILMSTISYSLYSQTIDIEGNSYKTVTIGNQIWMAENLNTSYFQNGDKIYQATTKTDWINANKEKKAAWCYLNFDSNNGSKYGKLYNWYAVSDPRGLAPKGLKIPDPDDWNELVDFVSGEDKGSYLGRNITAQKLMSIGEKWAYNEEGYDKYGFNAKPSGYIRLRKNIGYDEYNECFFSRDITWGVWWSRAEEEDNRWSFYFVPNNYRTPVYKGDGYSVRAFRKK
ncbi:fibrobacter succinogenes major paralogous domain-containing protein [Flavobacteriaceae bacterium]|nr:fibrobacter succinogenes major paralogous domain-containing protein [Flavobacteriaceae bacterium]